MTSVSLGKKSTGCALLLTAIAVLIGLLCPSITLADGGGPSIAMTDTFAKHHYEIPAGASASSPDISITVINEGTVPYNINMTTAAPLGVNINLSETNFSLNPGGRQSISIEIQTTKDAAAGNYTISITTAESIVNPGGGVQTLGDVTKTASLTVTGDSAEVSVTAISPDGTPVPAVVRLLKLIDGRLSEVCYNESGHLEAIVSPGNFTAQAYVGGQLLNETTFDVAANQPVSISLIVGTIFFQNPGILSYHDNNSGKLAYAHIYYTLINEYQKMDQVNVKLLVKFNGNQIDERDIFPTQTVDTGSIPGVWDYTPTSGWSNGVYGFTLELFVNNVSYGNSPEMTLVNNGGGSSTGGGSNNLALIIGIVCAVAILLIIAFYVVYKSRKRKNIKHIKHKK